MSRPNPFVLAIILIVFAIIFGGAPYLKGGLYLDTHEGDTYHLLDILFRMMSGARPHFDFSTPLGIVALLPFWAFMDAGFPAANAIIFGQLSVAAVLLPIVVYAAATRLSRPVGYYFGFLTIGLILSLTYGGGDTGVSISMYYNRWSWAIAFIVIALALLQPRGEECPRADSALVGALCALLLLMKVTYFVALVPAAAVALAFRWKATGVLFAFIGGVFVIAVATTFLGFDFWFAYLADLKTVSDNELRPYVGVSINIIVSGPAFFGATVLAFASVLLTRRAGHDGTALALLLLVPGLIFITYQNFGNDPTWLLFMPVVLLTMRPAEGFGRIMNFDLRRVMEVFAAAAVALNFPSLVNGFMSTLDHAAFPDSKFVAMLPPDRMGEQGLFVRIGRAYTVTAETHLDRTIPAWAKYSEVVEREPLKAIAGIAIPQCELKAGPVAYFEVMSDYLIASGVAEGSQLFLTDIVNALWFFGPFEPLHGGAPWYYGDLTGIESADYVVVPKCSIATRYRDVMIDELLASDVELSLVANNDVLVLFRVDG